MSLSRVVETSDTEVRTGPDDVRVGDVLHVVLETTETPFGDPAVSLDMPKGPARLELAMKEIADAFENHQTVLGRVLNPLNGGYAVGVGGIVGFCPYSNCSLETASRVGVLQPFYVNATRREPTFNLVLCDVVAYEQSQARRKYPRPAHWQ